MNNRIKELRYVKASELAPDPRNPRRHPAALLAYPSCTKPLHISKKPDVRTPKFCTWEITIKPGC